MDNVKKNTYMSRGQKVIHFELSLGVWREKQKETSKKKVQLKNLDWGPSPEMEFFYATFF